MNKKSRSPIPINIIAGPLGVGKTTVINQLLKHRPHGEGWAVLVNEYGLVGLDAALMESESTSTPSKGVEIREVAGGCICCSAGFMFEVSLVLLLQRRPARLLIEPTGLAALSGILDTLDRPGIRESVDVRSIICLMDPERFREDLLREQVIDQVKSADVLLASRADLASTEKLHEFNEWAQSLFPPKRFVGPIEHGQFELDLLDAVADRETAATRGGNTHGTDHHHDHEPAEVGEPGATASTGSSTEDVCDEANPIIHRVHRSSQTSTFGWICWAELVFDAEKVACWLNEISALPGARRTKAVLHTSDGWLALNFADGIEEVRPSGYRRDSRLELIIEGEALPELDELEHQLRACMIEAARTNGEASNGT